jgi:integrase/recombinase XerD
MHSRGRRHRGRHFGEKSQKDYIRCVKSLTVFLGRPPETADIEDLRRFRLHLIGSSLSVSSVNAAMQALRFFFSVTLDRPELLKALFRVQGPQKLPTVLTQEEVASLLDCVASAKQKAALSVAYGAGLGRNRPWSDELDFQHALNSGAAGVAFCTPMTNRTWGYSSIRL